MERASPAELPELMDATDCDRGELAAALDVLGRSARWLGGNRFLRRQVDALLRGRRPGTIRCLDVGAGGGQGAIALSEHLRRGGWSPTFVLADLHPGTLTLCRDRIRALDADHRVHFVRLDGEVLPFADDSVDIAVSAMTLHHLEDPAAERFVCELERVSRLGWAIVDLRRSRIALAAIRLLASTAWRGVRLSRADGPVSVRRSFTPTEVRTLLRRVGLSSGDVEGRIVRWAARGSA